MPSYRSRTVRNLFNDHFGNGGVDIVPRGKGNRCQRMIAVFDDTVDVADMNAFAAAAEDAGIASLTSTMTFLAFWCQHRCRYSQAEVEEPVFYPYHRADRDEGHVDERQEVTVHGRFIAIAHGDEVHLAECGHRS